MNCLFLCSRLAGYFYNAICVLADTRPDIQITIIARPNAENAPFNFKTHPGITIHSRADFTEATLTVFAEDVHPDYVYISGWSDRGYRKIGRQQMKSHCAVVMGMDNQWKGLLKQRVMATLGGAWVQSFCSYIWVPGVRQYEYARRIGFKPAQILRGLYTADVARFQKISRQPSGPTSQKSLLFMGNMWQDKGVVELVAAFQTLSPKFPNWKLKLVGGGPLVEKYKDQNPLVEVLGFVQPDEMNVLLNDATAFCLPSYHDAWAVVIHEAACMGMPIVATDVCGAVTAFVDDGYNGYLCEAEDEMSLCHALAKLMSLSDDELETFGKRSLGLSSQITPELWASKVLSVVNEIR